MGVSFGEMSLRAKTITKIMTYIVLGLIIPIGSVFYDYQLDQTTLPENNATYSITLGPNNSSQFLRVGELPRETEFGLYMRRDHQSNNTQEVEVTEVEEDFYEEYINGLISGILVDQTTVPAEEFFGWFNFSVRYSGTVWLHFDAGSNLNETITISGFYIFDVQPYYLRNGIDVIVGLGLYLIALVLIRSFVKNIRISRGIRRTQQERLQEEEEFYNRLDDN